MDFSKDFIKNLDLNFEISKRKTLNLNVIKRKVQDKNLGKFIIDISINGYSTKQDFDFVVGGDHWSDVKDHFVKGELAKEDPEALTVKRAIRVCAEATTAYIKANNVVTTLTPFIQEGLSKEYSHLGAMYNVPESQAEALYNTWVEFDELKKTNIADSALRIIKYRFPNLEIDEE